MGHSVNLAVILPLVAFFVRCFGVTGARRNLKISKPLLLTASFRTNLIQLS
jgi:hypothetical protein